MCNNMKPKTMIINKYYFKSSKNSELNTFYKKISTLVANKTYHEAL